LDINHNEQDLNNSIEIKISDFKNILNNEENAFKENQTQNKNLNLIRIEDYFSLQKTDMNRDIE
jgi:hypothetical protein